MHITFIQDIIDIIRGKKTLNRNCSIINIGKNLVEYDPKDEKFFKFNIIGENNQIVVKKLAKNNVGKLVINVYGDNNKILIDEGVFIGIRLFILNGQNHPFQGKIENSNIIIGRNCRIEEATCTQYNSNSSIHIGNNCLISLGVKFYNTDGHPIYNKLSSQLCNPVKSIKISSNCWIGYNASILKNVHLCEGTIVGWGSVVSKSFNESSIAIAGNPAKIVKRDVTWKPSDDKYIQNEVI